MPIDFRYAHPQDYERISKFLDEYWAKDHIYVRSRPLFDWTFQRRNLWPEDGYSFAVGEVHGELVAILGGIPFQFNEFGKKSTGVWIVNYVVRPDYRKGSTALQLLSMFRRPPFSPVIAFGINPATSSIYRILRGEVLKEIPRHFLVMPGAQERMRNLLQIAHPDFGKDRISSLASAFELTHVPNPPATYAATLSEDWDRQDWSHFACHLVGAARDLDFLSWRYLKHPQLRYRFLTIPDGSRSGLIVWRLEMIQRSTEGRRVDVDRIARIVEFLPVSRKNAHDLFALFLEKAAAADAFAADYYSYHGPSRHWIEEMGFCSTDKHPEGNLIPSRFQPLDGKGGGILSAMFTHEGTPACSTDSTCVWYWTKADSDQDRPN